MSSKKDLIEFTRSFPGADAQILGRMTNSYVTGDTIEYKTITVKDTSSNNRDVNITNTDNKVNISGSLNVLQDINCKKITIQDTSIFQQNVNITNSMGRVNIGGSLIELNIGGSLNVSGDIKCRNTLINYLFAVTMATGELIANLAVANLAVVNVIRATGVICEGILMGKNEITYTGNNLDISGNLNVVGDIHTHKKLSSNTLDVNTSIHANTISTTMSATFGKDLYVGGDAKINGSIRANDVVITGGLLYTPSIQMDSTRIYAKNIDLEFIEIIDYDKTVIVTAKTDGTLTYCDKILFVGKNGFRGTLEITEIKSPGLYSGTMTGIINITESIINFYGAVTIGPSITKGKLDNFSMIGSNNVVTGGTNKYLGINGVLGFFRREPGSILFSITAFAITNLTP
jgi:cytoskeletal protein CcmA (bactofilin family)